MDKLILSFFDGAAGQELRPFEVRDRLIKRGHRLDEPATNAALERLADDEMLTRTWLRHSGKVLTAIAGQPKKYRLTEKGQQSAREEATASGQRRGAHGPVS